MTSVDQTLSTLKKAKSVDELEGRRRLAKVQNRLVDLLAYLEELEGFTLFPGQRKKATLADHKP